ncbi:MAG: ABC transporter ATP-binding protein [Deltaproteobacteria bacterium]|nr:MAG: ABC transporter ATP-binding protein [Deltaproteobacteria bacterium]
MIAKVLRRLAPYRWLFVSAVVQVLLIGALELAKPWPLKVVVDNVLAHRPLGWPGFQTLDTGALLLVACGALVAVYGLLGALSVTSNHTTSSVGQRMVNDFRSELYAHLAMSRRITALATDARVKESALWAVAQRTMGAIRVIQAFTTEKEEHRRFVASSGESLEANLRLYTFQTLYSAFVSVLIAGGTAAVLWFGARHVLAGTLTVGEVLVFTSYLASLYAPINSLTSTYGLIQGARVGAERVFEILETAPDLVDGSRELRRDEVHGAVTFEDVRFGYDASRVVLKGIGFHARAGDLVALVGATGAGKTTLVGLIPRFYDPGAGRVLLDGIDVREFRLRALRQQIAMVLQPPLVFPTTLRENVAYGRPDASRAEIAEAVRLAQLEGFVERLPDGLETIVGEAGATLSAGEQLRVTIARALLRDAPLLILDEPTAALDATTEALVMQGLERLMTGRTTFVIAHRLSTVRRADTILVLDDGRIVEQGTFPELVARGGVFARLHRTQFGEEANRAASS